MRNQFTMNHVHRTCNWLPAIALTALVTGGALAQTPRSTSDGRDQRILTPAEYKAQLEEKMGLADSALTVVELDTTPGVHHFFEIQLGNELVTVHTWPHSTRAASYRLLVSGENGSLVEAEPGEVRTVRGEVVGFPGSRVSGSLLPNGAQLSIALNSNGSGYWVEPVDDELFAGAGTHVVYESDDVLAVGICATEGESDGPINSGGGGVAGGQTGKCFWFTDLALDTDFLFFQNYGSSVTSVENQINSIINTMNVQYETNVEISHTITAIVVRTSQQEDPYTSTTSFTSLLGQFQAQWTNGLNPEASIARDVAELWTGRDFDGNVIGVAATIGGICTNSGFCTSMNIGNFACRTDLSAHELGHLWNGSHCSCPSFTMNPSLGCANVFSNASRSSIIFHRESRPCIQNDCLPDNNMCDNAIQVNEGTTLFDSMGASTSGLPELACDFGGDEQIDNDIWYRYTSACTGPVTASVCTSDFDTRLSVFEFFCPIGPNEAIACGDDECGNQSEVSFQALAGVSYLIRIGGANNAEGSGELTISGTNCLPTPHNDSCGVAEAIGAEPTAFSTLGATSEGPDESILCGEGGAISNDIWYRIESSEIDELCMPGELVTISICDADFDTRLALYAGGCTEESRTLINCNDDSCGTGSSVSFVPAPETLIYRVRIGSGDGSVGTGTIQVSCGAPATPCPTDTDGNNATDVDDLVAVILAWDSADPDADVNDSGAVDVDDLVAVILNWGPCM